MEKNVRWPMSFQSSRMDPKSRYWYFDAKKSTFPRSYEHLSEKLLASGDERVELLKRGNFSEELSFVRRVPTTRCLSNKL